MPVQAGIHLVFGGGAHCVEMDSGLRWNDTGDYRADPAHRIVRKVIQKAVPRPQCRRMP
jgi:hypothetical protein